MSTISSNAIWLAHECSPLLYRHQQFSTFGWDEIPYPINKRVVKSNAYFPVLGGEPLLIR